MKHYPLFCAANHVYKHAFWLYHPQYVLYKKIRERNEIALLRRCIKPGDTVVDIGANIGFFTSIMARLSGPRGKALAIEPDARNFALLSKRIKGLSTVTTYHAAISDRDGMIDVYISHDLNVDHRTYPCEGKRDKRRVRCYALDSLAYNKRVDFVKMDIQGYEYTALRGMRKTLTNNPHCRILMELWPYGLKCAGASTDEIIGLLTEFNLHAFLLTKGKLLPYSENLVTCAEKKYYSLLAARTKP